MARITKKQIEREQSTTRAGYSFKNAGKIGPELVGKTRISEVRLLGNVKVQEY